MQKPNSLRNPRSLVARDRDTPKTRAVCLAEANGACISIAGLMGSPLIVALFLVNVYYAFVDEALAIGSLPTTSNDER